MRVRAVADRKCDRSQGDLPLVPGIDIHRRAEPEGRRTAAGGCLQLVVVPGQARCDWIVAAKWVGRGGGMRRLSSRRTGRLVRLQAERTALLRRARQLQAGGNTRKTMRAAASLRAESRRRETAGQQGSVSQ